MSIAKAVITGTVYRNPEKRFTGTILLLLLLRLILMKKKPRLLELLQEET